VRPSGQTGFTRLRSEIRGRSHDSFVDLLFELLAELIPGFTAARRLGALDREKVDMFVLDDTGGGIVLAVQAKGFEKPFGKSQFDQCRKEVAAYDKKGPPADHYILAINRRAPDAERKIIDADLAALVAKGKVKTAELLDEVRLITRLKQLAFEQLERWSILALARFQAQLRDRLAVVDYISEVPFGGVTSGVDPADFIVGQLQRFRDSFPPGAYGRDVSPPRFLVTSTFGFGKTSTLQALGSRWAAAGGKSIYVPAALLEDSAFHNGAGLSAAILDVIRPEGVELSDEGLFLLRETLRTEIATVPGWLLLIDGIDESPNWRHHRKLGKLWMSSADMALPLVASVRDEVYESRMQEFQDGGGRALRQDFFERLTLEAWPDSLLLRFLDAFIASRPTPDGPALVRFRDLVACNAYGDVYGDIPRRPLFLGMLAEDAWAGREPETDLDKLYDAYVRQKLARDRYSIAGVVVRSGEAQDRLGEAEYVERMVLAMQDIAGEIATRDGALAEGSLIDEQVLIQRVGARLGYVPVLEDLSLNSLLMPAGRDPATRQRQMRFAHHSFLDWFAACWSVAEPEVAAGVVLSQAAESFAVKLRAARVDG